MSGEDWSSPVLWVLVEFSQSYSSQLFKEMELDTAAERSMQKRRDAGAKESFRSRARVRGKPGLAAVPDRLARTYGRSADRKCCREGPQLTACSAGQAKSTTEIRPVSGASLTHCSGSYHGVL